MPESFDFRSRYITVLKLTVFAVIVAGIAFGISLVAGNLSGRSKLLVCQKRLQSLGVYLMQYREGRGNQLPRWLTEIWPMYLEDQGQFICPADPNFGKKGCFPDWMKQATTWRPELDYADLDGPTLDPATAKDTIPCSYYYPFNQYPMDVKDRYSPLWSQQAQQDQAKYGSDTPVVRCFWHLAPNTPPTEGKVPSLLEDLTTVRTYPKDWRTTFGE